MARKIPPIGSGSDMINTSPIYAGTIGTVSFKFRPNWNSGDGIQHSLISHCNASGVNRTIDILKFTDNNLYAGPWTNTQDGRVKIADTGLFSSGVWMDMIVTWNNGTPLTTLYIGGVSKGTKATTVTFATATNFEIGNNVSQGGSTDFANGDFSDVAYWNVNLTQGEISSLSRGMRPSRIRRASLLFYAPLNGLQSPEPDLSGNAKNLTLNGTIAAANDPPLAMFTPMWPRNYDVVVAPSTIFRKTASRIGTRTGTRQTWAA